MSDRRYLLSLKELWEGSAEQSAEQLKKLACTKLDRERLRKLGEITLERKRDECIGAGLLLQLGVQQREDVSQYLTVSQVIAKLGEPIEPEYTYSERGKPYFKNIPIYFNLSHSEEYVFCVFSKQEVGADIQYQKQGAKERIVKRFFTEAEQDAWDRCPASEKEPFFYKMWTRKEAYGKLTGEGIAVAAGVNVLTDLPEVFMDSTQDDTLGVCWEEYDMLDGYQITVCKRAGEKE